MLNLTGEGFLLPLMGQLMRGILLTMKSMEKEFILLMMGQSMKEISRKESFTARGK